MTRRNLRLVRVAAILVLAAAAWVARRSGWLEGDAASASRPPAVDVAPRADAGDGSAAIDAAFAARRSGVWVQSEGRVVHLLADDLEGSRHQRWLLDIASGLTLKISHNIDLAERLPLRVGDTVRFRGRYEHNEKGGVVHWTHHDPDGRLEGGWIELEGRRYR